MAGKPAICCCEQSRISYRPSLQKTVNVQSWSGFVGKRDRNFVFFARRINSFAWCSSIMTCTFILFKDICVSAFAFHLSSLYAEKKPASLLTMSDVKLWTAETLAFNGIEIPLPKLLSATSNESSPHSSSTSTPCTNPASNSRVFCFFNQRTGIRGYDSPDRSFPKNERSLFPHIIGVCLG